MDELTFNVTGFPPAKSEALSMLGAGHPHAPRVLALLEAARSAVLTRQFTVLHDPVGLEVVLRAPVGIDPWDATNYLGGIADVLEDKGRRSAMSLAHLGELESVAVYRNDRQIREIHYRQELAERPGYSVRVYRLAAAQSSFDRDRAPTP